MDTKKVNEKVTAETWGVGDGPVLRSTSSTTALSDFSAELRRLTKDGPVLRPTSSTTAMVPYISTDRADLQRILEHADRIRNELQSIPAAASRVSAAQWQSLTHELYALLALTRRIKARIE